MTDPVERFDSISLTIKQHLWPLRYKGLCPFVQYQNIKLSKGKLLQIISDGLAKYFIHRDQAVEYCEVCPYCQGSGKHERGTVCCQPCRGKGVVAKKEEN